MERLQLRIAMKKMLGMYTSSVEVSRLVRLNFRKTVRYCSLNRYPPNPFRELLGRGERTRRVCHHFARLAYRIFCISQVSRNKVGKGQQKLMLVPEPFQ
jgi:hypothetical protein